MDSSYATYTSPLIILIFIYIFLIYYSEKDDPNNIINEKTISYVKWGILFLIIIIQLSTAVGVNSMDENAESQVGKICIAVLFTWFLLFIPPNIYLYYFTEKSNNFNGKASFYLNTVFENLIGYLFVSSEANKIFLKLNLMDEDITDDKLLIEIKKLQAYWNNDHSRFINQFNIFNFDNVWTNQFEILFRVYEEKGKDTDKAKTELEEIKNMLFNIVKRKYVVGKCIWFFYNCIMCFTISLFLVIM
jgi:hypothetical protein